MAVRLDHIVDEYRDAVDVGWRSFLLRPTPAPRSLERFRAYTQSWLRPASQAGGGRFRVGADLKAVVEGIDEGDIRHAYRTVAA